MPAVFSSIFCTRTQVYAHSHKKYFKDSQVVVVIVGSDVDGDWRLENAVAVVGVDKDARGQRPDAAAVRQPLVPRRRGQILALRQSGLIRATNIQFKCTSTG